jgi:hypothetical protein
MEMTYTDETSSYLVAGRVLEAEFSEGGFAEFCGWLDEVAAEAGQPIVVVPAGNFGSSGIEFSEGGLAYCALGVLIGSTDTTQLTSLAYNDLLSGVAQAEALPWDRIAEVVAFGERDGEKELNEVLGLYATATGPLAGVVVGFGVPVMLRDPDEGWEPGLDVERRFLDDPTTVAATVPGLAVVGGNGTDQTRQSTATYGVEVASELYDGRLPAPVDISAAAHADRMRRLAQLSDQSAYHLMAHYD